MSSYWELVKRIWRAPGNRGRRLQVLLRSVLWLVNTRLGHGKVHHGLLEGRGQVCRCGGNVGLYTLPASKIVKEGQVVAVEPSLRNWERLEENMRLNGITTVHVKACALGEKEGGMAFCEADALAHVELAGNGPKVPVRTLDSILPEGEISLLKVDVEGFELSVFQGAENAMRAERLPVILFEMNHSHERYGVTEADIFGFLRVRGYQIARYEHAARQLVTHDLEGDVVAFTPRGEQLIHERLLT